MDGGIAAFPGLAKPVSIDCDALPAAQTARWRTLVERAGIFGAPYEQHSAPSPDARAYTIAVDDGGACRTLTVTEPIANEALRALVTELRAHAAALRGRP